MLIGSCRPCLQEFQRFCEDFRHHIPRSLEDGWEVAKRSVKPICFAINLSRTAQENALSLRFIVQVVVFCVLCNSVWHCTVRYSREIYGNPVQLAVKQIGATYTLTLPQFSWHFYPIFYQSHPNLPNLSIPKQCLWLLSGSKYKLVQIFQS